MNEKAEIEITFELSGCDSATYYINPSEEKTNSVMNMSVWKHDNGELPLPKRTKNGLKLIAALEEAKAVSNAYLTEKLNNSDGIHTEPEFGAIKRPRNI
jgi:hypothetical protein